MTIIIVQTFSYRSTLAENDTKNTLNLLVINYNLKMLSGVVILLPEINKQKLDVSSEGPSSRVTSSRVSSRALARNVQFLLVYFR
jgi:hypothetical protein